MGMRGQAATFALHVIHMEEKDNISLGYMGAPMTNQSPTDQLAHTGWEAQKKHCNYN